MITRGDGDLLSADVNALVNTVNCVGVMGKGIALQFKRRYPDMFKVYEKSCKKNEVKIGEMFVVPTGELEGPEFIINFPTKTHWRAGSKLEYIREGLVDLVRVVRDLNIKSIAIPPLGAGNGGLDWNDVEPLIAQAFASVPDVQAVVYPPNAAPRSLAAPSKMGITWGRAVMLELLRRYVDRRQSLEPWEDAAGASHLEIQKLMYFANYFEPKLKLDFSPGRYGPYSEIVRHLLQDMEGAFVSGFGDGTSKVLDNDPISLTESGRTHLDEYLGTRPDERESHLVNEVMRSIHGFEGPYGVELLASTHWVANEQGAREYESAAIAVRTWTKRKGRIYSNERVSAALEILVDRELI